MKSKGQRGLAVQTYSLTGLELYSQSSYYLCSFGKEITLP